MNQDIRTIIVGAGEAGAMIVKEFSRRGRLRELIGFIDDNSNLYGTLVEGLPVLGGSSAILDVMAENSVTDIIIAMPSVKPSKLQPLVAGVTKQYPHSNILILPSTERYFDTTPLTPSLTHLEYGELLDRDEYTIDLSVIRNKFAGKRILVTGAGGSIGSELCRQLLKFDIVELTALGRGEHSIYELERSLAAYLPYIENPPLVSYRIVNVNDLPMIQRVFREKKPHMVIHAAAHKHVPLMEFNRAEAVRNNVAGTWNILEVSRRTGLEDFVLVSTDKAVRPTSIMGATKRMAELVTGMYHRDHGLRTTIVRFGNVLGSRGSVIPLFHEQIMAGGPVTVTDPEVRRYFMTIPEAALLILNAAALSRGGGIFALDMGEQRKLIDIARQMIRLHGLSEDQVPLTITGLRPGEKMYEELFYCDDSFVRTENERIYFQHVMDGLPQAADTASIMEQVYAIDELSEDEVAEFLRCIVPEYVSASNICK